MRCLHLPLVSCNKLIYFSMSMLYIVPHLLVRHEPLPKVNSDRNIQKCASSRITYLLVEGESSELAIRPQRPEKFAI